MVRTKRSEKICHGCIEYERRPNSPKQSAVSSHLNPILEWVRTSLYDDDRNKMFSFSCGNLHSTTWAASASCGPVQSVPASSSSVLSAVHLPALSLSQSSQPESVGPASGLVRAGGSHLPLTVCRDLPSASSPAHRPRAPAASADRRRRDQQAAQTGGRRLQRRLVAAH